LNINGISLQTPYWGGKNGTTFLVNSMQGTTNAYFMRAHNLGSFIGIAFLRVMRKADGSLFYERIEPMLIVVIDT
jgi:hypothetical protein